MHKTAAELCERSADARHGPRFVLSSESVDLMGDIVMQSGMELVSERIPAQVDHSGRIVDQIGHWTDFQTSADKRTSAELVLLPKGLSKTADLVRSLLDAGVRMAASIGFVPKKTERITEADSDRWTGGYRYLKSLLVEASVVVVPANPDALSFAKSLLTDPKQRELLEQMLDGSGAASPGPRPVATRAAAGNRTMTTIAERIQAGEASLAQVRDALAAAQARLAEELDSEPIQAEVDTLLGRVARESRSMQLLRDSEVALAGRAAPAGTEGTGGAAAQTRSGSGPAFVRSRPKPSADLVVRSAIIALESHVKRQPFDALMAQRYPNDEGAAAVARICIRAAQAPALTNVPGWAQELTRQTYAAFMELLQPVSVVPKIPMQTYTFDGYSIIKIPKRNQAATPNLAAAFRAEGAPIRVGAASLGSVQLTPKTMGVIGTFSNELFERSTPNIETEIREWILQDTAIMLDGYFLSNTAPIAGVSPGGIQNGIGAGNTRASTGKTVAQMLADLQSMVAAMGAANLLKRPVWIMNPVNASWLAFSLTAVGTPAFPGITIQGGTLVGYPAITSTTVPIDTVYLIDGAGVGFSGGAPSFFGTDVATLHEEDTNPLPIASTGTPNTVAAPARSLFQTNSAALRAIWEIDWTVLYAGAVQVLTAVNWK